MKKLFLLLFLAGAAYADTGFLSTIQLTETDGSPRCQAGQIKFSSGTLSCLGQVAYVNTGHLPPFVGIPGDPNSAASVGVSSRIVCNVVDVPSQVTVTGRRLVVGATGGALASVCLYNNFGVAIASTAAGGTAIGGTGNQTINYQKSVTIPPGYYYQCLAASNVTATFTRAATNCVAGCSQTALSGTIDCPNSISIPGSISSLLFAQVDLVSGGVTQ